MLEELCKRIQHCWATFRRSRNKRNVGSCWLKSLTFCAHERKLYQHLLPTRSFLPRPMWRNPESKAWNLESIVWNPEFTHFDGIQDLFRWNPWVRNPEPTTRDPGSTIRDPESHGLRPRLHYIGRSVPCHSTLFVAWKCFFFFRCFRFSFCSVGSSFWSSFFLGPTQT